ncbi:MAG: glycosyltransferase [Chloroflexota bacterium]
MISYHTCPLATLGGKDTGGMNVYVRDLTRELGRRGIGVDVYTRSQDEHVPHVLHDLGHGNRIVHVRAGPETPLPKDQLLAHLAPFTAGVREFAQSKAISYDVIHSHYWLSGLSGLELRRAWGRPLVHMFHTLGEMKNRVARTPNEREPDRRLEAERLLLREADRTIAATQAEVVQFQWLYKADTRRVEVIPPGVDTGRFYAIPMDEAKEFVGIGGGDHMLLYVGRIEPLKGIDSLFEAVAILQRKGLLAGRSVCLAIIGGDPDVPPEQMTAEMSRLQSLSKSLGITSMVTFLGRRDQDTLPYYYSAAEAVVVPSHYESFGLVALEAMACGTPVVASETGGLVYLVRDGETGFHVPVGDSRALADRIGRLITDSNLRNCMGRHAENYATGYAWPIMAGQIVEVYETLVAVAAYSGRFDAGGSAADRAPGGTS